LAGLFCIEELNPGQEFKAMKTIAATLLILASVLAMHFANGESSPNRPAGVDARNWIPVSDQMGFVVTTPHQIPARS
jgi:hypothetical protein